MAVLTGGSGPVELGRGISIIAPGLLGTANLHDGGPNTRGRQVAGEVVPGIDEGLARMDMTQVAAVAVEAAPSPGAPAAATLRNSRDEEALVLEVPDLGPEAGQVVLMRDDAGGLSWHFPEGVEGIEAPRTRGAGGKKRFVIANRNPHTPADAQRTRSLFGSIGRKLLKVIVYPITDVAVGTAASWIAERWESKSRAYALRAFGPANYQQPVSTGLTSADIANLGKGRALLFVHGTFSTAHSAFYEIPASLMATLHERYGGRLFAFNHYSLSHDPDRNVRQMMGMLSALSPGVNLEVDIICHSRGGLVARCLVAQAPVVNVKRVVFVGVPNQGTPLADPNHMIDMIDRFTTATALLPTGGVKELIDGILTAVKIIAHGAIGGLDGLASMDPKGDFLRKLNVDAPASPLFFAIAADYQPHDTGLHSIISRGGNAVMDRIFAGAANDLVVPELGVYDTNGATGFAIANTELLLFPSSAGVMHTTMFTHSQTSAQIEAWLS